MTKFWAYAVGPLAMSICSDRPLAEVLKMADLKNPTGLDHGWHLADEPFKTGQPNPCPCEHGGDNKHYLLVC